jgi:SAM-dependent methyltransferase
MVTAATCDPLRRYRLLIGLIALRTCDALVVCGVDIPHAKASPASRALDGMEWPASFPFGPADLQPMMAGNDGLFYTIPKFVHHAGEECRDSLTRFYGAVLPTDGDVLDLCSSWTSHYPKEFQPRRCAILGLNPLELVANPSKTEWKVQNLNNSPVLPYADASFDLITNSLSVDYMTNPIELFDEMARVLRPGGLACMAFTNRCFPTKVVPAWTRPFTEERHVQIVGTYFRFSACEWEVGVADVSPDGWVGQRDPMVVVVGRKPL